ncbi:hypothetical protein VIGAN_03166000, partial [Vigna angularis var. angularis]
VSSLFHNMFEFIITYSFVALNVLGKGELITIVVAVVIVTEASISTNDHCFARRGQAIITLSRSLLKYLKNTRRGG